MVMLLVDSISKRFKAYPITITIFVSWGWSLYGVGGYFISLIKRRECLPNDIVAHMGYSVLIFLFTFSIGLWASVYHFWL